MIDCRAPKKSMGATKRDVSGVFDAEIKANRRGKAAILEFGRQFFIAAN